MKSLLKFGAVLLSFGFVLSMLSIMIIRTHAVSEPAAKVAPAPVANPTVGPAAKS